MQSQAAQKPVADQNMLAAQSAKETEQMRSQNAGIEQTDKSQVRTNQEGKQSGDNRQFSRKRSEEAAADDETDAPAHPYKGHHLDIKL